MPSLTAIILFLSIQYVHITNTEQCLFCIGSVSDLTGHFTVVGEWVAGGYLMAVRDYLDDELPEITNHIFSLNETCLLALDLRDFATNIKVGIQQIFSLSSTFGQCAASGGNNLEEVSSSSSLTNCTVNMPFIVGPAASGDALTTNPITEAFNLLQFAPIATSTFLSSFPLLYRPIPSDDFQAKALIDLCLHFNWDKIGILYMSSDYGTSLQRAITKYANWGNISSTTFSYISLDNVTLENNVQSMANSAIYIFVLIVKDGDVPKLSSLLHQHHMVGYPYYYMGVDAWLYASEFPHSQYIEIYGGMIGTCPWAPRMEDETFPFPLNISLAKYKVFYHKWMELQANEEYHITYNRPQPAIFTIYAYDTMLTVIKLIDEFISRHDITDTETLFQLMYNKNVSAEFVDILNDLWFIGLSGNVSFSRRSDEAGDRMQGLFSYCNINPNTGSIHQIGYNLANSVHVNQSLIIWPLHSYRYHDVPQSQYVSLNNGISNKSGMGLPIFLWFCICLSLVSAIIYLCLLYFYRNSGLVRAAQWKLNLFMVIGCMVCYVSLLLQGIDESFPVPQKEDYNWDILCNARFFLLNLSFCLIYGPLCAKIYRINKIFKTALRALKKQRISDQKLLIYNFLWTSVDSTLCIVLLAIAPFYRHYEEGEMSDFAVTEWGSCYTASGWIYMIALASPKLIFSLYSITLSISVYSTVSMMKFNEGLQVLVCIVISTILIFMTVVVVAFTTINSATQSVFVYSFMSFMLLMVCHFCCAVMVLPRIFAIWRGHDEEAVHDEGRAVKAYLKKLKMHLNMSKHRFTDDLSRFSESSRNEKRLSYSVSLNRNKKKSIHEVQVTPIGGLAGAGAHKASVADDNLPPLADVNENDDDHSDTEGIYGDKGRENSTTITELKKESDVFAVSVAPVSGAPLVLDDEDDAPLDVDDVASDIMSVESDAVIGENENSMERLQSNSGADQFVVDAPASP